MSEPGGGLLTHAGAVVWRVGSGEPLFLLVTARRTQDEWVLPKGHIEELETPRQTAQREVREETGLDVQVGEHLGTQTFTVAGKDIVCAYYLAEAPEATTPGTGPPAAGVGGANAAERAPAPEGRQTVWLPLADAVDKSTFPAGRRMLEKAAGLLS